MTGTPAPAPGDAEERNRPTPFVQRVIDALPPPLRSALQEIRTHERQTALVVDRARAHSLLEELRDRHGFDVLVDVTAVDYLNRDRAERFQVIYILQSRRELEVLRVHAWVPEEDPTIATAHDLWRSARWGERECHDMFGIEFVGAPDMRRFLMPEDYPGFPLRKDYPLKGKGERVQFPRIVPQGDEIKVKAPRPYPVSIGRGMHTPEYLAEVERDSKPRS